MLFIFYRNHYDYDDYYNRKRIKNVIDVPGFEALFHNFVSKFLYKVIFQKKIKFPFKIAFQKRFNKFLVPKVARDYKGPLVFIFTAIYFDENEFFFEYLKNNFDCYLVLKLTDKIESFSNFKNMNFDDIRRYFDFCCTYNEVDARKYNLSIYPPLIDNYDDIKCINKKCDVYFVGRNKGRLDKIFEIYSICQKNHLACDFTVLDVPTSEQKHLPGITYNKKIDYITNLSKVKSSKCVLNLVQEGACGITLRDYEAIGMNKYIITDNSSIYSSMFYKETNILNANCFENEIYKIKEGLFEEWDLEQQFTLESFYMWLIKKIKERYDK